MKTLLLYLLPLLVSAQNIHGPRPKNGSNQHRYSILGNVSGSAATLTLSGAASGLTTTDGSGNYSFLNLENGSYVVAPSESGYSFSPSTSGQTISGANIGGVNFTATANLAPPCN